MHEKDEYFLAGSLLRTFGTKGEIILHFKKGLPKKINQLESILVDVDGKLVPFFIHNIQPKSSDTVLVKIEGLDNDTKNQEFVGADFYLSNIQKEVLNYSIDIDIDVIGYEVRDSKNRFVGNVIELIDIAENPLLRVKTEKKEILLPANDELVIEVDDDFGYIILTIPNGLLEID
ncbi:MAG: ribosome maturation factor RimM [Thiohalospira sp.]